MKLGKYRRLEPEPEGLAEVFEAILYDRGEDVGSLLRVVGDDGDRLFHVEVMGMDICGHTHLSSEVDALREARKALKSFKEEERSLL